MTKILSTFASDQSGATAIEYGALVMFVGLALVLTLEAIGLNIANTFTQLKTIFGSATAATPS
jgi:pilus assembly protein Flp/PilA